MSNGLVLALAVIAAGVFLVCLMKKNQESFEGEADSSTEHFVWMGRPWGWRYPRRWRYRYPRRWYYWY